MVDRSAEWIEPYLRLGERVLWAGRPRAGIMLRRGDALTIPCSFLWGGFAIVWELGVISTGAPLFAKLWGVPFVLIGLYMIAGRFFFDAYRRVKTYYALADQRAIVVSTGLGGQIRSLALDNPVAMTLEQKPDRSGTIAFGPMQPAVFRGIGLGSAWNAPQPLMFEEIPDAGTVYQMVLDAQRQARRAV